METVKSILSEYEKVIERLFNANSWLKSKGISDWDLIKGTKAYNEYIKLGKEAEQLQKTLHEYLF